MLTSVTAVAVGATAEDKAEEHRDDHKEDYYNQYNNQLPAP